VVVRLVCRTHCSSKNSHLQAPVVNGRVCRTHCSSKNSHLQAPVAIGRVY
jgi:hypothetical protein